MCFRPSPVKENNNQPTCGTCGMPIDLNGDTCSYCGDSISPQNQDEKDFSTSVPARIL